MPKKEYENIEVGKLWHEYTEEERMILPQLPASVIKNGKAPYGWNGYFWEPTLKD